MEFIHSCLIELYKKDESLREIMIMFRQHYPQIHSGRGGGPPKVLLLGITVNQISYTVIKPIFLSLNDLFIVKYNKTITDIYKCIY